MQNKNIFSYFEVPVDKQCVIDVESFRNLKEKTNKQFACRNYMLSLKMRKWKLHMFTSHISTYCSCTSLHYEYIIDVFH